jgi:hypothetical protein
MRVAGEQIVNLPPNEAFRLFSDLERSGEYSKPVVERRKITEGPVNTGTKYNAIDQWPGKRVQFTVEITEYDEPDLLSARWSEPMPGGWLARFRQEGDGTRLSFEASMEPGGILRILSPVLRPWAQRQTRAFLGAFKTWAENQVSQSG